MSNVITFHLRPSLLMHTNKHYISAAKIRNPEIRGHSTHLRCEEGENFSRKGAKARRGCVRGESAFEATFGPAAALGDGRNACRPRNRFAPLRLRAKPLASDRTDPRPVLTSESRGPSLARPDLIFLHRPKLQRRGDAPARSPQPACNFNPRGAWRNIRARLCNKIFILVDGCFRRFCRSSH